MSPTDLARWHDRDVHGHVIDKAGVGRLLFRLNEWRNVKVPALNEQGEETAFSDRPLSRHARGQHEPTLRAGHGHVEQPQTFGSLPFF